MRKALTLKTLALMLLTYMVVTACAQTRQPWQPHTPTAKAKKKASV